MAYQRQSEIGDLEKINIFFFRTYANCSSFPSWFQCFADTHTHLHTHTQTHMHIETEMDSDSSASHWTRLPVEFCIELFMYMSPCKRDANMSNFHVESHFSYPTAFSFCYHFRTTSATTTVQYNKIVANGIRIEPWLLLRVLKCVSLTNYIDDSILNTKRH